LGYKSVQHEYPQICSIHLTQWWMKQRDHDGQGLLPEFFSCLQF
jgi:hypothetical protein